jgi:hypothetical protein
MSMPGKELADAEESLVILEETERFLIEEVGRGGMLTLANTGQWAEDVVRTRELIVDQRAAVERLKREVHDVDGQCVGGSVGSWDGASVCSSEEGEDQACTEGL